MSLLFCGLEIFTHSFENLLYYFTPVNCDCILETAITQHIRCTSAELLISLKNLVGGPFPHFTDCQQEQVSS